MPVDLPTGKGCSEKVAQNATGPVLTSETMPAACWRACERRQTLCGERTAMKGTHVKLLGEIQQHVIAATRRVDAHGYREVFDMVRDGRVVRDLANCASVRDQQAEAHVRSRKTHSGLSSRAVPRRWRGRSSRNPRPVSGTTGRLCGSLCLRRSEGEQRASRCMFRC